MAAGIIPAALELMNQFAIRAVEKSFSLGLPTEIEGLLIIQVDGSREILEGEVQQISKILQVHNASNILTAADSTETERLWLAGELQDLH